MDDRRAIAEAIRWGRSVTTVEGLRGPCARLKELPLTADSIRFLSQTARQAPDDLMRTLAAATLISHEDPGGVRAGLTALSEGAIQNPSWFQLSYADVIAGMSRDIDAAVLALQRCAELLARQVQAVGDGAAWSDIGRFRHILREMKRPELQPVADRFEVLLRDAISSYDPSQHRIETDDDQDDDNDVDLDDGMPAPDAGYPPTPVKRSSPNILVLLSFLSFVFFMPPYLVSEEDVSVGVAALVGLGILALTYAVCFNNWKADCPRCGGLLDGLSEGVVGPCPTCRHYGQWSKAYKGLALLQAGYVSNAGFGIPFDDVKGLRVFPPVCAGCGRDTRRTRGVTAFGKTAFDIPRCGECDWDARFASYSGQGVTDWKEFALIVQSYRFYADTRRLIGSPYFP